MYISRITLEQGPALFDLLRMRTGTDGYYTHKLLWNLFPGDYEKRQFLFFKDNRQEIPQFLMVSKKRPEEVRGMIVDVKSYDPKIVSGQQLAFSLTANPVVARKTEEKKHSAKHDLWMDARLAGKQKGLKDKELAEFCESAIREWLLNQGRERHGFDVTKENVIVDGYLQNSFQKSRNSKPISFNSIHYSGLLTVTDMELFKAMLFNGIGRSRSFGCGLMLVRKV